MARLRCCGRFCYWRLPLGPWCCGECDRRFDGPMPKSAEGRFWDYIEELGARLDAKPDIDLGELRRIVESTTPLGTWLKKHVR